MIRRRLLRLTCAWSCAPALSAWSALLATGAAHAQTAGPLACSAAAWEGACAELRTLIAAGADLDRAGRVALINNAVNQHLSYRLPPPGSRLRWRLPEESWALGHGDCSDYAILKFFLLLASETPASAVRLLYAMRQSPTRPAERTPHLVALVRTTDAHATFTDALVLDMLNPLAVALPLRDDLHAVMAFDRQRLFSGAAGADAGSAAQRLRPWGHLLARREALPNAGLWSTLG